jgi:hypothetical protein
LAHHVSRIAPMGARVLINGTRYKDYRVRCAWRRVVLRTLALDYLTKAAIQRADCNKQTLRDRWPQTMFVRQRPGQ